MFHCSSSSFGNVSHVLCFTDALLLVESAAVAAAIAAAVASIITAVSIISSLPTEAIHAVDGAVIAAGGTTGGHAQESLLLRRH